MSRTAAAHSPAGTIYNAILRSVTGLRGMAALTAGDISPGQSVLMGSINWVSGSPLQATSVKGQLLSNPAQFRQLAGAWESTAPDTHAPPTSQYMWFLSCAEAGGDDESLAIELTEDRRRIAALAPMRRSTTFPPRQYLLGAVELAEPGDFLYRDSDALRSMLERLVRQGLPFTLSRVFADSPTVDLLRHRLRASAFVVTRPLSGCPYIDLQGAVDDRTFGLSNRLLADLRRARRKAEAAGAVEFEVREPRSGAEFLPLYEQLLAVEAAGWKSRMGSALQQNRWQRDFFRRYGTRASRAGMLRMACLRIDGEPVAVQLAVVSQQRYWMLKIGYDEARSKCSPGLLLVYETLRYAAQQRLRSLEFLGSVEGWTRRWTTRERPTVRVDVYPAGARGVFVLAQDCVRYLGGKVRTAGAALHVRANKNNP